MKSDLHRSPAWAYAFAALFLATPLLLFHFYPISLWANTDYETLGLADAVNMAYRLADHTLYEARGLQDHPGVPFYFISWLALALIGYPVASNDSGFFARIVEHAEDFHQVMLWLNALAGAVGVYIFASAARKLVPIGVVAIGLLVWLVSTPATLLMFVSPSIDSFAIVLNGLFFVSLLRLVCDPDVKPSTVALSACVGALAYLNKLSYVYIPLALAGAGALNFGFRRGEWAKGIRLSILFTLTLLAVIVAVGYFIIGWSGFHNLLRFHKGVILGTGMYGAGPQDVVSSEAIRLALATIPGDKTYAVLIALAGGTALVLAGLITGLRRSEQIPVAILGIGSGAAAVLSAMIVIKHYDLHYTAGVSATLPACVVSFYLLVRSWGYKPRMVSSVVAAAAILFMADQGGHVLTGILASKSNTSRLANTDLDEIHAYLAGGRRPIEVGYRAPFAGSGEGFVIIYASVPRLTDEYVQASGEMFSCMASGWVNRDAGAYIIDKAYFPTAESIRKAPNFVLLGPKPVAFKDGDRLVEFRTVFLLIPG